MLLIKIRNFFVKKFIFNEDSALFDAEAEFFTTYITSIISASLGLAKCMKNGGGPGGCLDGLLSCRHLLAVFACFGAKIFSAGYVVSDVIKVVHRLEIEYKESRNM